MHAAAGTRSGPAASRVALVAPLLSKVSWVYFFALVLYTYIGILFSRIRQIKHLPALTFVDWTSRTLL